MSPIDLGNMSEHDINIMWECITMIESQKQLLRLQVQDWPNLKKERREKIHKDLMSKAYPKEAKTIKNKVTQADLNRILGVK